MASGIPTGYSSGYPDSVWSVAKLVALISAVLTSSSGNAFNGTVGATTPAAGSFTTLTNTGAQVDASTVVVTPTTGFTNTVSNGVSRYLMTPAGTLATGTLTFPAVPVANQVLTVMSTQTVTTLTLSGNSGFTISNAPTTIAANTAIAFYFRGTNWYREQ